MLNNDSAPDYSYVHSIESTIPIEKYDDLCNCVFCWNYRIVKTCDKCDKLYCLKHESNHLCFKEKPIVTTHSIISLQGQQFEPMEVIIS